jgi:hypothetical protein
MSRTISQILVDLEQAEQEVANLESALGAAKAKGKALFAEFKSAQGNMATRFGVSGEEETPSPKVKKARKPRPVEAGFMTSVTRAINTAAHAGKTAKEAKDAAMASAHKLAAKAGIPIPDAVLAGVEAKLKDAFPKAK